MKKTAYMTVCNEHMHVHAFLPPENVLPTKFEFEMILSEPTLSTTLLEELERLTMEWMTTLLGLWVIRIVTIIISLPELCESKLRSI